MATSHITPDIAVQLDDEIEIISRGEGDERIAFCCAPTVGSRDGWTWYLKTNGDPVLLDDRNVHGILADFDAHDVCAMEIQDAIMAECGLVETIQCINVMELLGLAEEFLMRQEMEAEG